jgi:integrase
MQDLRAFDLAKLERTAGAFAEFTEAHGFEISFHGLRHTAAILMLRQAST